MCTFSRKYMVQFLYVSSKNLNFTKRYLRKKIIKIHKNISWYYTKSINWGHTSNFIDNFKKIFVCWNKILENTIQNNPLKPGKFLRQIIYVAEFCSSKSFDFAVHSNFTCDSDSYDFPKLCRHIQNPVNSIQLEGIRKFWHRKLCMKICYNWKSFWILTIFLVWYFFEPKCPNICNIYYSQKDLKHFGLEMLIAYGVLEHFEIYHYIYKSLCIIFCAELF